MNRNHLILVTAALLVAPMTNAHDGADGVPGTPDTTCETGSEWADHDYGPPAAGLFIQGLQESNLEDCDGDFNPTDPFCWAEEAAREDIDGDTDVCERFDDDRHDEYTRGGAWLLVNSGDGVTGGTVLCFGRDGHHPNFGPVTVSDLVLGQTVPFTVEADTVDATGLGDPCGDFQSDVSTSCVGTCTVTYPAGLDGSYQVYVGFGSPGTMGHVCTPGGDCDLGGIEPIPCLVGLPELSGITIATLKVRVCIPFVMDKTYYVHYNLTSDPPVVEIWEENGKADGLQTSGENQDILVYPRSLP